MRSLKTMFESGAHRADETLREAAEARRVPFEDGVDGPPVWFGIDKRDLTSRWRSWLTVLAMTEDANEGFFDAPPPDGNFTRIGPAAVGQLRYDIAPETTHGFNLSDAASRSIMTRDGLASLHLVKSTKNIQCAHPLASCRIGEDPHTSATSLCVNPSLAIAAVAERASSILLSCADKYGVEVKGHVPPPWSPTHHATPNGAATPYGRAIERAVAAWPCLPRRSVRVAGAVLAGRHRVPSAAAGSECHPESCSRAAVVLLFSLVASGQIKLRKIDGWQKIGAVLNQQSPVAA